MPHTPSLEAAVQVEGLSVRLGVRTGRLHIDGPFAGNIEVVVVSNPTLPPRTILESLAIQTASDPEPILAMAYESFPDGRLEITYHSPMAAMAKPQPDSLALRWVPAPAKLLGHLTVTPVHE
ncbi:MAG TPA: hypothetical protein VL860_07975 [Planctomycetota bacterium]|nr:hypothetical protein [Planctomycetota bacterium]